MSELPEVETIRKRIESAPKKEAKFCLMTAYLFCARVSEVIGKTSPSDLAKTQARGPTGKDVKLDVFELGPLKEEVAIFTVRTAKRGGKKRNIALPLNPKYEPWTEQLYNYFQEFKNDKVFSFTRQKASAYARDVFGGFMYQIDSYKLWKKGEPKKTKTIKEHPKPFCIHALRHLRATELIEDYGCDGIDLSIYGGWTLRSMIGVGSAMSRYAHLNWRRYFPKLLKERQIDTPHP